MSWIKNVGRVLLFTFLLGLAFPTGASLLIHGALAVAGFPFTLGSTSIGANSSNPSISGLNVSSTTVTNPIIDLHCAGVITATTGSGSSNPLTVASATGWSIGMGIAVHGATGAGSAELITTITNIVGNAFTLASPITFTVSSTPVFHDDTACLSAALVSGKNVHIPLGNYNITSELEVSQPVMVECEGAVMNGATPWVGGGPFGVGSNFPTYTGGTVIWNRGTVNRMLNITTAYWRWHDCTFQQDPTITPTGGWAIFDSSTSTPGFLEYGSFDHNLVIGTFGGMKLNGFVQSLIVEDNYFLTLGGASNTNGAININQAPPAGDIKFSFNEFNVITAGPSLIITGADITQWIGNKFNGCDPCLHATGGGTINGQSFEGDSFEGWNSVNAGPVIVIDGSAVNGIAFVGGECGVDNGKGCINISSTANVSVQGMTFSFVSGAPITNTSTGHVKTWGNIGVNGTGDKLRDTLDGPYTVSTLPTGIKGAKAYVSDAVACTFLGSLTGGGSAFCEVTFNGAAWVGG